MRKLVIGFSKSTKKFAPFSWAIRLWDKTDYSHCYTQFENRRFPDLPLIYQASHDMMNFMTREVFLESNKVVEEFIVETNDEQHEKLLHEAMKMVGRPYGVKQVIGIAIADLLRLKKNPFTKKEKTYTCSEWCGIVLDILGYEIKKDRNLLKPSDIYAALKQKQ